MSTVLGIFGLILFGIGAASLIVYAVTKAFLVGGFVLGMVAVMIAGFVILMLAAIFEAEFG
jgi:hypothetical protein